MKLENKHLISGEETFELLRNGKTDVVLTMGAGDIDRMAENIIEVLKSKN